MSDQSVATEPAIKRAQIGKVAFQLARDGLRPVHQFRQRRIELPLHLFRQKTPPALGQQCRFHIARNPAFERRFKIRAGAVDHDCVLASLYPHRMRHPRWNDDRDIVRTAMIVAINKKMHDAAGRTCAVAISPDLRPRVQRADEHESPWRCWRTCAQWPIALARTLNSPARLHPGGPILRTIHAAVAHGWRARKFRRQESRSPQGNAGSSTQSAPLPRPRRLAVLPAPELDSPVCSTRQRRRAANRAKYLSRIFSFCSADV